MEAKLIQISSLSQKDKGPAFVSLIPDILSQPGPSLAKDLHALVDTVVNQDSVGLVVGRQVLSELVKILGEGTIKDVDLRKRVVEDTLETVQPRIVSYEEQVRSVNIFSRYLVMRSLCRSTPLGSSLRICLREKKIGATLPEFLWEYHWIQVNGQRPLNITEGHIAYLDSQIYR